MGEIVATYLCVIKRYLIVKISKMAIEKDKKDIIYLPM